MTEEAAWVAAKLTEAQRDALIAVCRTNGGGITIPCRVGHDGYGIPINAAYRKLYDLGLIQGKSCGYKTVVHTRDGLAVYRAHLETRNEP